MKPSGLAPVTLAMCLLNVAGLVFLEKPVPAALVAVAGALIVATWLVLWSFWKGRNWARWLVLLTSGVALLNLIGLVSASPVQQLVIVIEAALGAFLLYWLNTRRLRAFFTANADTSTVGR